LGLFCLAYLGGFGEIGPKIATSKVWHPYCVNDLRKPMFPEEDSGPGGSPWDITKDSGKDSFQAFS
jgi:hypothetical protein